MNQSIESRLIAELMLQSEAFDSFVEVSGDIDEVVFLDPVNRVIYAAIKQLRLSGNEVDIVSVAGILESEKKLNSIGGRRFLAEISSEAVSSADIKTTARLVVEIYFKHRIKILGDRLSKAAGNGHDVFDLAEKGISELQKVVERGTGDCTRVIGDVIKEVKETYREAKTGTKTAGVMTGIKTLDVLTNGFKNGDMVLVGARPSTGKSNVGFNILVNASESVAVGFVSAEMDTISAIQRSLSACGEFDDSALVKGILTADEEDRFQFACDKLKDRKVYINDKPAISIFEVEILARKWKRERNIGILIVDYLQLLRAEMRGRSRENEVSVISKTLKKIARELKIPVVALAQLNRESEKSKQLPKLSDLRESGSIEQDADVAILLHSFESCGDFTVPANFGQFSGQSSKDIVLFILAKNRRGVRNVFTFVNFDKRSGRMTGMQENIAMGGQQQNPQTEDFLSTDQEPF